MTITDREEITSDMLNELLWFLQGIHVPKDYIINQDVPKLSAAEAWTVIYMLQEWIGIIPDKFEMCAECGCIYNSDEEGNCCDLGDSEMWNDDAGFNYTKGDEGKCFCGSCR